MTEIILPPSPNWYLSTILACAKDGTVAWGSKNSIVIAKKDDEKQINYNFIEKAHHERVTSIAFSPNQEDGNYRLVSGGEDNIVKLWNLKDFSQESENSTLESKCKVIAVDWVKQNTSLICFISEDGLLVTWNINYNISHLITLGKLTATCLSCCPHDGNLVAIGSKSGLIYLVDIRGSGTIKYKLRGHDEEIVSLSWCPVPVNVLDETKNKEFLLASGAKDRFIYLWRAGSDGRYEYQITFPAAPLNSTCHRSKVNTPTGNFTAVCWLEPTTLFTSSPWGQLIAWNLLNHKNKKEKLTPQLVHDKHIRGLFSIAGFVDNSLEKLEEENTENWRTKISVKAIWTIAQDRQVVCCDYINNIPTIHNIISTQGGFVYCIASYALEPSQIAFGVGDAMIRVWNLSASLKKDIELQFMWEKIKGQVRTLSWHPVKENLLAFATNEGRVGVFDTNVTKPPILYKQYLRHIVYSIGWGPAPNVKDSALYACGDGELVYYDPDKVKNDPISVTKRKECTEFCWKADYSMLAVGFADGCISFFKDDLSEYSHKIHSLNKSVQCLTWHPQSTASDLDLSSMKNYLAVAINGTYITIFDISIENNTLDEKSEDSSFYKTIATLNGHSEKVVCLAWSPHISGYLVSGSYDCTAQVWNIESQEIIATYSSHFGPIQCCMWSPLNQDLIFTGSSDFTLRIWNIKSQIVSIASSTTKLSTRGKRTKKKKSKNTGVNEKTNNKNTSNESKILEEETPEMNSEGFNSIETDDINKNLNKIKKKKLKTYFPGYAEMLNDNKLWCKSLRDLLEISETHNQLKDSNAINNINEDHRITESNEKYPYLLGNKKNFEDALNFEKNLLNLNECHSSVTDIEFWSGNLKKNLQEAMKQKSLNDYLVSLAPNVSLETWKEACEAYANQLIFEENPRKAVSYLLCIDKVHEAIDIFLSSKLFKEAYVLASCKLNSNDPIIKNILKNWANYAFTNGHFQNTAECYIKLGEYEAAAKVLQRRKDLDSLILSVEIAELINDQDLIISLAEKTLFEALIKSDINSARLIIKKHQRIQYRQIEVEVFTELTNILENINDDTIVNWLKGLSNVNLLESVSNNIVKCQKEYSLLLGKDVLLLPDEQADHGKEEENERKEKYLQICISHQLALFILASEQQHQLQHVLKALDMVLKFITKIKDNKFPLLIKYVYILDNKNLTDLNSIFNSDNSDLAISLRAYYCYSIIDWFNKSNLIEKQIEEIIDFILNILEKCIKDLFDQESIEFWAKENEIKSLEKLNFNEFDQPLNIDNLEPVKEHNATERKNDMERLNQLKANRKEFIEKRVASPNPLHSYIAIDDFSKKTSNEKIREKIDKFTKKMNI